MSLTKVPHDMTTGIPAETGTTGSIVIPVGTTAQRDGAPQKGYLRYNETTDSFEGYGGSTPAWGSVSQSTGLRNRIINGAMVIDQRNAGASVSITNAASYITDRWNAYSDLTNMTCQRTQSTVPVGFTYALGITVGTGASPTSGQISRLEQRIEGFNFADMYWGGANAQSVTLSFWVRTSVTGTHSGALVNSAGVRSYPFTFSVSSANTWEYKTVTVAGEQSGTWVTDNGTGCKVQFNLGTGSTYLGTAGSWGTAPYFGATGSVQLAATSGATFYITGVQLEKGSTATSFDYRPYGTELALCQRYYEIVRVSAGQYNAAAGNTAVVSVPFKVSKRDTPTVVAIGAAIISLNVSSASFDTISTQGARYVLTAVGAGVNAGTVDTAIASELP